MRLEDQVASLELSKRLKELGVRQESYAVWCEMLSETTLEISNSVGAFCKNKLQAHIGSYSAFTANEIGEMLPEGLNTAKSPDKHDWICWGNKFHLVRNSTEANARCLMLIYLIEKGIVDATKIK